MRVPIDPMKITKPFNYMKHPQNYCLNHYLEIILSDSSRADISGKEGIESHFRKTSDSRLIIEKAVK